MAVDYTKRRSSSTPATPTAQPTQPAVSLAKVTLTKASPRVSLTKEGSGGRLHVNLNWNARPAGPAGGGFLKRMAASTTPGIDLDLGCLYELSDGTVGVVQALGTAFGAYDSAPFIALDGDDRSGTVSGGENLFINLDQAKHLRRVLVFACIYAGVGAFDEADGVVTIKPHAGPPIEVRLDAGAGKSRMCAIALLENKGGELSVQREVKYINGSQAELDRAYGFGLNWSPGRK